MTCGIYCFTFKGSDRPYIGQSVNIERRITRHKSLIKENSATKKIQTEANIYGNDIEFIILEECEEHELDSKEIFWVKEFDSISTGLNTSLGGESWGGSGTDGGNSKYTKEEIISVFNALLQGDKGLKEIANLYNINEMVVHGVYKGHTHLWLKEEFPIYYELMRNNILPRSIHMDSFFIQHKDTLEIVEVKKRNETADRLGISRQALSMVKSGTRKHTGGWQLYKKPE